MTREQTLTRLTILDAALNSLMAQLTAEQIANGEVEDITPQLRALEDKIIIAVSSLPHGVDLFQLGYFLGQQLTGDELQLMKDLEKDAGETTANAWFTATLLRTGKYREPSPGVVLPV